MSEHPTVIHFNKLIKALREDENMDNAQLVTELQSLQTSVVNLLAQAQAAPAPTPPADDPVWDAVKADLVTGGWAAPVAPAPAETETAAEDIAEGSEEAPAV